MSFKKVLSVFFAFFVTVSTASITVSAENMLEDVESSWAAKSIERWVNEGIVSGDNNGNFNPEKSLTRAEFAVILSNLLGLIDVADNKYSDLENNTWYTEAILKCTAAEIMYGSVDNGELNSNPNATITRQEAMVMFGRAIGIQPDINPDLSEFTDGSKVPDWAAGYVSKMINLGIISGVGNNQLGGSSNIDRASTMTILDRAISEYVTEPGTVIIDNNKGFVIINIENNDDQVIIKGETEGLIISAGSRNTEVITENLKVNSLKVDSDSKVILDEITSVNNLTANNTSNIIMNKESSAINICLNDESYITILGSVGNVFINDTAAVDNKGIITNLEINGEANIINTGTINNISINNKSTIQNTGKIENSNINANNVIIDGNKPDNIYIDESITEKPSTSNGDVINANVNNPIDMPYTNTTPENNKEQQSGSSSGNSSSSDFNSTYKLNMYFIGDNVSTTMSSSSNFNEAFDKLINDIDVELVEKKLNDIKLILDYKESGKLEGWQTYYDNYYNIVENSINNSTMSSDDKNAAKLIFKYMNPSNIVSEDIDVTSLLNSMKELFVNVDDSTTEQLEDLFTELYKGDIKITVNNTDVDPVQMAKLLHNATLTDWYNYYSEKEQGKGEISIFFKFGDSTPEINGIDLGTFVGPSFTIK